MEKIGHAKIIQTSVSMILSGIPIIGRGFCKNGIKQTTEEALSRIAQIAE